MYYYVAFGLRIQSELKIPEFQPALFPDMTEMESDVVIRYGKLSAFRNQKPLRKSAGAISRDGVHYSVTDIGTVFAREGREIVVDPEEGAESRGFRFLVTGPAMGLICHQRGLVTLHACAVAFPDGAVIFLGNSGMGKSTLAAAMHKAGYPLLTDDLLVLRQHGPDPHWYVEPGFPFIKLWPDAYRTSLSGDPDALNRVHPSEEKRLYQLRNGFHDRRLPARRIYALRYDRKDAAPTSISPLTRQEACVDLIRYSYASLLLGDLASTPHFLSSFASLSRAVPCRRLLRTFDINDIENQVRLIENDTLPHAALLST